MTFSFMTKFAHEIPQKCVPHKNQRLHFLSFFPFYWFNASCIVSAFGLFRKKVASQILKHILTIVITFWKDNYNATKMHFISIPSH